jgi:hypothetical protein
MQIMPTATRAKWLETEASDDVVRANQQVSVRRRDREMDGEVVATLGPELGAPARARHAVTGVLREGGYGEPLLSDAALVVSELAANAVRHARTPFTVIVAMDGPLVHVAVEDAGPSASADELGMVARPIHGLGLIDAVSARWGVEPSARGKLVWAELSEPASSAEE